MKIYSVIGCVSILIIISIAIVSSESDGEVEDESEFSYEKNAKNGPAKWGTLKPAWKMCATGRMQSPIGLLDTQVVVNRKLGPFISHYLPASNTTLKDRGHDIMLKFEGDKGAIGLTINGFRYQLQQVHWHSPSEHTKNGKRYILEEHLVHASKHGRYAVVAFLYKLGKPNAFLQSLEKQLKRVKEEYEHDVGMIDPKKLSFNLQRYYRYYGSLTTPPCTENVIWTVSAQIKTVTSNQVKLLQSAVHDDSDSNARPIQPTNRRVVHLYTPDEEIISFS